MTDTTMTQTEQLSQEELLAKQASDAALQETEADMTQDVEHGGGGGSFGVEHGGDGGSFDVSTDASMDTQGQTEYVEQTQQESVPTQEQAMNTVDQAQAAQTGQAGIDSSYLAGSMVQSTMQELGMNGTMAGLAGSTVSQMTKGKDLGSLLDSGGMTVLQAGLASTLLSKLTGNKLVGIAAGSLGVLALQKMDILPDSFSGISDYINNVKGYFNGEHQKEDAAQQQAQQQMDSMDAEVRNIQNGFQVNTGTVTMELGREGAADIKSAMTEGGRLAAESGAFVAAGSMDAMTLQPLSQMMQANMNTFAEKTMSGVGEDGQLTKEMTTDLVAECKAMQDGFAAYSDAAKEQISAMYGSDPEMQALAMQGLENVMQAETAPFYQTMAALDAKYHFLSEEDKSYFEGIAGVTPYADSYGATSDQSMTGDQTEQTAAQESQQEAYQQQMQASQQTQQVQQTEEQSSETMSSREVPEIVKESTSESMSYEMY